MTDEQQRIAIAVAMGWNCDPVEAKGWGSRGQWVVRPDGDPSLHSKNSIPDYLNDLNAMHSVEVALDDLVFCRYTYQLKRVIMRTSIDEGASDRAVMSATARQRAEACLRTIGKWEALEAGQ